MNDLKEETELLYAMANIQPRTTGLNYQLYSTFDGKRLCNHEPRVKVKTNGFPKGYPIIIDTKTNTVYPYNKDKSYDNLNDEDKLAINEATSYIEQHKEEFLAHWNAQIGDKQLKAVLKKEMALDQAIQDAKDNGLE